MTDEQAFLTAIQAAPEDDAHLLVYADWLEERGDSRSDLLRQFAALADHPERFEAVYEAAARLLEIDLSEYDDPEYGFEYGRFGGLIHALSLADLRPSVAFTRDLLQRMLEHYRTANNANHEWSSALPLVTGWLSGNGDHAALDAASRRLETWTPQQDSVTRVARYAMFVCGEEDPAVRALRVTDAAASAAYHLGSRTFGEAYLREQIWQLRRSLFYRLGLLQVE
jgi:uncharacterized protein (TIGR02996 family)